MKKWFLLLGLCTVITTGNTQPLITNTLNRNVTSLNGLWRYIIDPYETGYYNYRYEPYDQQKEKSTSAFYTNYYPKDKAELVEYNFDTSPTMHVPGDWNSQNEKLLYYEGTVWLRKTFDYKKNNSSNRLFIYFGAVNYKAEVYLNGEKLGVHEGGFTPFNFEITSLVKPTHNYLVIKVDNKRSKEAVPTINTDWWNYGGITRDVLIIEEPPVFIEDYTLQLKKGSKSDVTGFVKINNASGPEKIIVSIPELKVDRTFTTNVEGIATIEMSIKNLKYWSPTFPKLYTVTIKSAYQTINDEIGFRNLETRGADIVLNGSPIFLKGISIHEENAMRGARAYNEADALVSLTWAKELGCNYVRLAHYPHNEYIIRLADKMGMMVWEEIPVYWTIDFANASTLQNAKQQLNDMIVRDKNRASVIIWSMANETPPSDVRNTFLTDLIDQAKKIDATRLISAALEKHSKAEGSDVQVVNDKIGEQLDIIAFNQYTGWYGGSLETAPDLQWEINFTKPVVISEFGGDALQGLHGDKTERWTEEYQEYLYEQNLKMIVKIPNIRGLSPWILADFRSPKRTLPGVQDGWNRKGLISNRGIKKKAFFTLQAFYKNK